MNACTKNPESRWPGRLAALALPFMWMASACGPTARALSYAGIDPILDTDWYRPRAWVRGAPGDPLATAREPSVPADVLATASAYAARMNSCALLVAHRGRLVLERYACGLDARSRPNGMSLAKTPAALLVGIALEEGVLASLDEPLERHLPEWSQDARGRISLRQLLSMSSGLDTAIAGLHLTDRLEESLLARQAHEAPGARFEYNNVNTQLVALVLERAWSRSYAALLSEKLWRPLGAGHAQVWLDAPGGQARAYCCLFATARDWLRLGLLMRQGGRWAGRQIVPGAWLDEMLTPSPLEPSYGLHVWLGTTRPPSRERDWSEPFAARDTFMLVGAAEQRVYVIPSHELVIVRLGREAPGWDDPYLPNLLVRALDRVQAAPHSADRPDGGAHEPRSTR